MKQLPPSYEALHLPGLGPDDESISAHIDGPESFSLNSELTLEEDREFDRQDSKAGSFAIIRNRMLYEQPMIATGDQLVKQEKAAKRNKARRKPGKVDQAWGETTPVENGWNPLA